MLRATLNTLTYAGVVTAAILLLSAPLSFLLARFEFRSRKALQAVLTFPASLPALLLAMGAFDLLGQAVTGAIGTCAVTAIAYLPWMLEPLVAALMRCDPALEEAARVSGARPAQAFLQASWPLVRREMLASAGLVFSMTGATFAVPYFLGTLGRSPFPTLTTEMVEVVNVGHFDRAFLLSVPLLVMAVVLTLIVDRLKTISDAGRPAVATMQVPKRAWVAVAWAFAALAIGAPLLALLARATASDPSAAWTSARSLDAFSAVIHHGRVLRASLDSLALAAICAGIVVAAGVLFATKKLVRRTFAFIYALPGTLIALCLLFLAASQLRIVILERLTIGVALQNTLVLIGIGYCVKYLSAGLETAHAALSRVSPTLVEAARLCGASVRRADLDVRLPLARPALVALFALLFMTFLPELTLSVLLFGPDTPTLGTALFDLATYTSPKEAAALAVALATGCVLLHARRA